MVVVEEEEKVEEEDKGMRKRWEWWRVYVEGRSSGDGGHDVGIGKVRCNRCGERGGERGGGEHRNTGIY